MLADIRQSPEYAKYLKTQGWIVENLGGINYFIRKIPLIGSVIKVQRPPEVRLETINKLAHNYHAFQIIIEPRSDLDVKILKWEKYKLSKNPYLPSKTLILDLTKSKEELIRGFKKDAISAIKKSAGIEVREVRNEQDLENFQKAWKASVNFNRYVPSVKQLLNLRKSFKLNPPLFLTSHNIQGKIIGGGVFTISHENVCYYWYAFTNTEGRSTLSQYSLLYKGILWGKLQRCKVFDFEGIYDARFPNKKWLGFTHFKKSFGGEEVSYPGCFTLMRFPL